MNAIAAMTNQRWPWARSLLDVDIIAVVAMIHLQEWKRTEALYRLKANE